MPLKDSCFPSVQTHFATHFEYSQNTAKSTTATYMFMVSKLTVCTAISLPAVITHLPPFYVLMLESGPPERDWEKGRGRDFIPMQISKVIFFCFLLKFGFHLCCSIYNYFNSLCSLLILYMVFTLHWTYFSTHLLGWFILILGSNMTFSWNIV